MDDAQSHYQPLIREVMISQISVNSRRVSSIMKESHKESCSTRRDTFGEEIVPKGKHRIKFKKEMAQVHVVENWKAYNVDVSQEGGCASCSLL